MESERKPEIAPVRVGFRYQDGEVLSPEREALGKDIEIPVAVIDIGDGEWLTLAELRGAHSERLEHEHEWVFDGYFWHRCATCGRVS